VTNGSYHILVDRIRALNISFFTIEIEVKVSLFGHQLYWLNEGGGKMLFKKKFTAQIGCEVLCSNL
jgi:hypothetical protein